MQSKGMKVNMNKAKVMISGESCKGVHNTRRWPCGVCGRTTPPQPFYGPFSGTTRMSRCQKRTSGLYSARAEADTPTNWLGTTPSRLTSAHLHHPPCGKSVSRNSIQCTNCHKLVHRKRRGRKGSMIKVS